MAGNAARKAASVERCSETEFDIGVLSRAGPPALARVRYRMNGCDLRVVLASGRGWAARPEVLRCDPARDGCASRRLDPGRSSGAVGRRGYRWRQAVGGALPSARRVALEPVQLSMERREQLRFGGTILPRGHDWRGHLQDEQDGRQCRNETPVNGQGQPGPENSSAFVRPPARFVQRTTASGGAEGRWNAALARWSQETWRCASPRAGESCRRAPAPRHLPLTREILLSASGSGGH